MEQRLENSLEQIIYILQDADGTLEYSRLIKRLLAQNADKFYDTSMQLAKLVELDYIQEYSTHVRLTRNGIGFKGFADIKHQEYLLEKEKKLNLENLELQNESLKNQNLASSRQVEIDKLTIENLQLQNRQHKRYVAFSIIGFIAGALLTNLKDIITLVKQFLNLK